MHILRRHPVSGIGVNLAILAFNALLIGALWVAVVEVINVDRHETIDTAFERNGNLAIAFEEYAEHILENADQFLKLLVRQHSRSRGKFDLEQFVADHAVDNSAYAAIALTDDRGNVLATNHHGHLEEAPNVADRHHFRAHLDADIGVLFVGQPVKDRISGGLMVPLTRRINNPDGSFSGVAMALVEHARFTEVLQGANLRQLDILSLVGLDGITRARLRGNTPTAGEDISKSPLFAEQARRPVGNYASRGQVDGIQRLFSYRTLRNFPLIATVGTAEADVLAPHIRRRQEYFWAAGIASTLIAAFTVLLIGALSGQSRAAARLARSRARFLATFNQAAVGIAHSDLDGYCIEVNQKLCDITGYAREELLGRRFTDITHPDDVAASIELRKRVLAKHDPIQSQQREKRYIRKDGSIVWCLLTTSVVRDEAGNIDYLAAVIQDITDRKAAEQALGALEQEQRRLAGLAETERARLAEAQAIAKMGSWETRFPELDVVWSAETHRIFGTDAGSFQPTHEKFLAFVHPEDRATVQTAFNSSVEVRSSHALEHRIVLADGSVKFVEERWRTFLDDQGQPVRAIGTCQDITDKKTAERDRAQLAAIVDSSSDAIISRDLDGVIISWNAAAERMFGWTAAEAIGRRAQIMAPPERFGEFIPLLERIRLGETIPSFETVRMRKDRTRFDAQISLSAVKDNQGKVISIAQIVQDISERKAAEKRTADLLQYAQTLLDSSPIAIVTYKASGEGVSANPALARILGAALEQAQQQNFRQIEAWKVTGLLAVADRALDSNTPQETEIHTTSSFGKEIWLHCWLIPFRFLDEPHLLCFFEDIRERKLAEAALRDYAERMRQMSQRLSVVEENERRNIHRELHDQIGAGLSALKLDLSLIGSMLDAETKKTIGIRLQRAQQLTGETIARIRDVMADLRPPALDDFGLLAALRTHAQPIAARLGIPVHVNGDEIEPRLDISTETALFRIAQEALTNIAKHARANQVMITLDSTPGSVTLVIADDGAGFDAGQGKPRPESWGLRTMRERAQAMDANLRIESSPGKGTRVIVELSRSVE